MSSPSLRPLINTCQKCLTSPANHEPRSPANGGFQNPGVCPQAVPSFLSPTPTVLFLALAPFSAQEKYRKPRSSVFLCSQTLRKRLLRRLLSTLKKKRSSSFAAGRRSSLVRLSAPFTSSASSQQQPQAVQSLVPSSFTVRRPNMGSCFACGKPGHWRSTCPAMAKQQPPSASK